VAVVREADDWALRIPLPKSERLILFTGQDALQAAGKLLPAINESGARAAEVQSAVEIVTQAVDPGTLFRRYAQEPRRLDTQRFRSGSSAGGAGHILANLPKEVRLALEMASHDEQERRALEGELALLEAAWREAEEVAQIADDMFVPESTSIRLEELKREG
jgi:hypothetical protein